MNQQYLGERGAENFGLAVFKYDKLVGELNGIETVCYSILSNNVQGFFLTIKDPRSEEEYIDLAMKALADNVHEVVSYAQINPSLLFFHEGEGLGFSFITNKLKDDDDEHKLIMSLKNYQIEILTKLYKNNI